MRSASVTDERRERQISEALRAEWRLFERVSVAGCQDGNGFRVVITLNQTLLRGAAEQQCLHPSMATSELLEARRLSAITACVERVNAKLGPDHSIRDFVVLG
ncbi:MAG TPA: hypothetical protein VMT37_02365 [Solirubrobacterales bacterium]|nr:hypothetical protein [Solirubrobacterales bacterium]